MNLGDNRRHKGQLTGARIARADIEKFNLLKKLATQNGIHIQPSGSVYVSDGELNILKWLATYQRASGLHSLCHEDIALALTLAHCAGTLSNLGLRLNPPSRRSKSAISNSPPETSRHTVTI
ncbi:MAG: hypothetical protein QM645_13720 [Asticcacaulis sp.]